MTVIYLCQMCHEYLYYTSLVLHIWLNGSLYFLNNALTRFLRLKATEWVIGEPYEQHLLERNVSIDEAKLFDQYPKLFEFVQKEPQPNGIYCRMMEHERWAKYFAICNTIACFSEQIKIAEFYISVMPHYAKCLSELTKIAGFYISAIAHYANVERYFP